MRCLADKGCCQATLCIWWLRWKLIKSLAQTRPSSSDSSHFGKHQIALKCDDGFHRFLHTGRYIPQQEYLSGSRELFGLPDERSPAPRSKAGRWMGPKWTGQWGGGANGSSHLSSLPLGVGEGRILRHSLARQQAQL